MSQENLYSLMTERNEYYLEFIVNNNDDIAEMADVVSIDKVEGQRVVAYANSKQYQKLLSLGVEPIMLTPPSMLHEYLMYDGENRNEYAWNEYPTYEAYESMMYGFANKFPDKCSIIELGSLESGRKILIARVNNGVTENKPKFLYVSTIHGDETVGFIMMLRLIDCLLTNENLPEVQNVMDNLDIFICPNANPDGTYYSGNNTVYGSRRFNANGIDLNRNYPDYIKGDYPYGDDYAAETEMFMQLANEYQFTMSATYHGGAELVNYPWDNNYERHVDDEWWQCVSREYATLAQENNEDYMTEMNNGITNGADWYIINGSRQDYMNYYRQCREATIECSLQKCPPADEIPAFWNYNYNSIFAYMNQCINGIHGRVIDVYTKNAVKATIRILNHDEEYSVVETQLPYGDFHRPIKGGEYVVEIKSPGYRTAYQTITVSDGERVELNVELEIEDSYNMNESTVITHSAYFYDSGGANANYHDDDSCTMTFKPGVKGKKIQIEFLEFSTEENIDVMRVYDGICVNETSCTGAFSGNVLPPSITATNPEGALTFSFSSNFETNDKGWKAIVRCVEPLDVELIKHEDVASVYPNPAKSVINIETNNADKILSWLLYNQYGQLVMKSGKRVETKCINVGDMVPGLYLLNINIEGKQVVKKVVIE